MRIIRKFSSWIILLAVCFSSFPVGIGMAQEGISAPEEIVKLIFIHHSTGENWLADGYGDLGRLLGENNYFVSDTNYGWGPDSIGDRTDVPDWPEWFRSPDSERYMSALYNESNQNSSYTRTLSDPGGENEIIMFKSCFPNSDISGFPDDPPQPGYDFTVANFKYIYNDLLTYFQSRPDKLFVVITQPPLLDPTHAENARAFSNWLVNDWLSENNYPLQNVVVFDFHNILTHPDNHHRYQNGAIEHIIANGNGTLFYDSDGDEHPNVAGSRKASEEFIPLLNLYYHRWKSGIPAIPPAETTPVPAIDATEAPQEDQPPLLAPSPGEGGLIDDFESGTPAASFGWTGYWDEGTTTVISCSPEAGQAYSGSQALHLTYNVAPESWATCTLEFERPQDWSAYGGLSVYMHADRAGLMVNLDVYDDTPDGWATYLHTVQTGEEMVAGWLNVELPWDVILGADWEGNPGKPLSPDRVAGIAVGIDGYWEDALEGQVWIDEVRLLGVSPPAEPTVESEVEPPQPTGQIGEPEALPEVEEDSDGGLPGFCPGSAALGGLVLSGLFLTRRRRR